MLDIIRRQMEDRDMHEQFQSLVSQNGHSLLVSVIPFVECLLYHKLKVFQKNIKFHCVIEMVQIYYYEFGRINNI